MIVGRLLMVLAAAVVCSGDVGDKDSCLRFGGASCCTVINAIDRPIQEVLLYLNLITERDLAGLIILKRILNLNKATYKLHIM